MMMPRRKDYDIFGGFFDDPFFEEGKKKSHTELMKTDIKEKEKEYVLEMDIPGYKKEDIQIELEKGYLTVTAKKDENVDESDEKENYIHKERFVGECSRSFYVGENVKEEDIKASFKNGTLKLTVPKKEEKELENKKYIEIEGE